MRKRKALFAIILILVTHSASLFIGANLAKSGEWDEMGVGLKTLLRSNVALAFRFWDGLWAEPRVLEIELASNDATDLFSGPQLRREPGISGQFDTWVAANVLDDGGRHPAKMTYADSRYNSGLPAEYSYHLRTERTDTGNIDWELAQASRVGFLTPWIHQKLLAFSGLISSKLDLVELQVNGKKQALYYVLKQDEGHFFAYNRLPRGLLLQFDRWANERSHPGMTDLRRHNVLPTRLQRRTNGREHQIWYMAKNIAEGFREGKLPAAQVFDTTKLALLFALYDLMGQAKDVRLDALRFYYNPVTSRLEPVSEVVRDFRFMSESDLIGIGSRTGREPGGEGERTFEDVLFRDERFFERYIQSLERVSQHKFIATFFDSIKAETQECLQSLYGDYPLYEFDGEEILHENQLRIRTALTPPKSLHAYLQSYSKVKQALYVEACNVTHLPLLIVDLVYQDSLHFKPARRTLLQPAWGESELSCSPVELAVPDGVSLNYDAISGLTLRFQILGSQRILTEQVLPWTRVDEDFAHRDFLRRAPNYRGFRCLLVDSEQGVICVKPGRWQIQRSMIIPPGFVFISGPGVTIDLVRHARILSYSPVRFVGTANEPVRILSSDGTGQGLVVLKPAETSLLEHVEVRGLVRPMEGAWSLMATLTFYEAGLQIRRCLFEKNRGPVALQAIRSAVQMEHATFLRQPMVLQYSRAELSVMEFRKGHGIALRVSGSMVEMSDIKVGGVRKNASALSSFCKFDSESAITMK